MGKLERPQTTRCRPSSQGGRSRWKAGGENLFTTTRFPYSRRWAESSTFYRGFLTGQHDAQCCTGESYLYWRVAANLTIQRDILGIGFRLDEDSFGLEMVKAGDAA